MNGTKGDQSVDLHEDDEEKTSEFGEEDDDEEIDPELILLREEIEQLEGRIQEEKSLSDKAESARRIAQEQKLANETQIQEKTQELAQLEKECDELMVEGRMYQLASREYDYPLKEAWTDKPEQALVVDLSRIVRTLEQAVRTLSVKGSHTVAGDALKVSEVEVVHVKADGSEISKTNIPVKSTSTVGEVLRHACSYWSLDPESCELENSQGMKLVRRDAVPADTLQFILKDRLTEAEEKEVEDADIRDEMSHPQGEGERISLNAQG